MKKKISRYRPLLVLILVAALGAGAWVYGVKTTSWPHLFMGLFFCQFSMLKLFHPSKFVAGFRMYDLLAKAFPAYAYIYPFIELGLGLAYLSFFAPIATYSITVFIMGINAIGVLVALRRRLDVRCACMGTLLDVPLSTVTLSEDIVMGGMAGWMLIKTFL